jgi:hypothetical protein
MTETNSMPTSLIKPRYAAQILAAPLLAAACWAQSGEAASDSRLPTATIAVSSPTPTVPASATAPASPSPSGQCPNRMPPDGGLVPVPGVTIRSINRAQIEIENAANRVYYFRVAAWVAENLVCGRGLVANEFSLGPVAAWKTALVGVMQGVPITVEVWDRPCGEGCVRPPVGTTVVPMSSLEPPIPAMT